MVCQLTSRNLGEFEGLKWIIVPMGIFPGSSRIVFLNWPSCRVLAAVCIILCFDLSLFFAARDWKDDVWKGKPKLWVYFMNPNSIAEWKWKYRGDPITVSLIIEWAKGWKIPDIKTPIFDITERSDTADIRVKFSGTMYI